MEDYLLESNKKAECYQFEDYMEAINPFPVCNHTSCVGRDNIGYTQGIFFDGIPFEAELWTYEGSSNVSFVFPQIWSLDKSTKYLKKGDIIGFHNQVERTHSGVLAIGMKDNGMISDFDTIIAYVEYLKEKGAIEFDSDLENGAVLLVTDIEGHDLVYVTITLKENGETLARTSLCFHEFVNKNRNKGIHIVK